MNKPATLKDSVAEWMPAIDSALEDMGIPISDRLMKAAMLFFKYAIIDSSYDSKEELLENMDFFSELQSSVNHWYSEKYGNGLILKKQANDLTALTFFHGQPMKIVFPSSLTQVEVEGETVWLIHPNSIYETESWTHFYEGNLNFEKIPATKKDQLERDTTEMVSLMRSTYLNILTFSTDDEIYNNMIAGVTNHINAAVSSISTLDETKASIGCWDMHLALEKTLKTFLYCNYKKSAKGHNIFKLLEQDEQEILKGIELGIDPVWLDGKDVIALRYSEKKLPVKDAFLRYRAFMKLINIASGKLGNKIRIDNSRILLKKPSWAI